MLNNYVIWFRGELRICKNFTVPLTPQSQTPQCHWHRRVRLHSVIDTTESDSTVSLTPQSQTPQCHWHHRVRLQCHWHSRVQLRFVIDTAESDSAVSWTLRSLIWHDNVKSEQFLSRPLVAFKVNKTYCYTGHLRANSWIRGDNDTAE